MNKGCEKLSILLEEQNWKEADQETARLVNNLDVRTIKELSIEKLEFIDGLWQQHSSNKFGFEAQRRVLNRAFVDSRVTPETCRNDYEPCRDNQDYQDCLAQRKKKFATYSGWFDANQWITDIDYSQYVINKPEGYLPLYGKMPVSLFQIHVLPEDKRLIPLLWQLLLYFRAWQV
ncbi:GUN4 domain-containing protein [Funiculus sociatus GB2-A5]|uniref:GUN4 domain-containing protein n=1 Tax=Funiculus sociatus GB2-A5 TaxID=2933946 RepID=A0ABV0JQQ6_9CYAN|nr:MULTISPECIES: GUN4 domain-containing protein [unclassified Trichocoleus]MBD1907628.1 GUN4 domain-containing protein [Trichocoleus sp. FACHB-832]MBD2062936.1 GUN4 domain-containing protein [Trichocoleus sp. FACHB-6]